jgi:hypothetical protein
MKYTTEFIKDKILSDDKWLEHAVLAIWKYQTASEKMRTDTHLYNGVGFNGSDGHFCTSCGNYLSKGMHMSEKQKVILRKKMPKYAGQLIRIIEEKNR